MTRMQLPHSLSDGIATAKAWLFRGLVILGGLALIWTLYGWLLPEMLDMPPQTLSINLDAESRNSAVTLAANLDAPVLDGNRINLLVNGKEIFPAMLASIRQAHESINILSYVYWTGCLLDRGHRGRIRRRAERCRPPRC